MIRLFFLILVLSGHCVFAQLRLLSGNTSSVVRINSSPSADTISLPFWEDFSRSEVLDTAKWQYGFDVYINNTQAIQQPTINVATFDGINRFGQPHNNQSQFNGPGDSLVSQAIDLSNLEEDELQSVFLSFYWQLKGNGDLPNVDDSLRLSFYREDSIWIAQDINTDLASESLTGGLDNLSFDNDSIQNFKQIIIQVNGRFLHEGFRFKFESFTSLNGTYDSWHLDYIYLNKNRNPGDTLHFDRSVSSRNSSLFQPYASLPVDLFLSDPNRYLSNESVTLNNLDNTPHPARFSYQIRNLNTNESSQLDFITPIDLRPLEIGRVENITINELPDLYGDSVILETTIHYITGDKLLFEELDEEGDTLFLSQDLAINDTLRSRYLLHNYIAYDDGSSEFAAGINLNQGELAVEFVLPGPDTLTDIDIFFPAISPTNVGEALTLKVWGSLQAEAILREFGGVIEATNRNEFQRFTLNKPLIVRDTFYIGFEQFTDNYIGVGFDRNNISGFDKIYTNTNRQWDQNTRLEGSLMIRPVFRDGNDFVLSLLEENRSIGFYPNPSDEIIFFEEEVEYVSVHYMNGSLIDAKQNCKKLDVSHLSEGIYLIIMIKNSVRTSQKLIIRR